MHLNVSLYTCPKKLRCRRYSKHLSTCSLITNDVVHVTRFVSLAEFASSNENRTNQFLLLCSRDAIYQILYDIVYNSVRHNGKFIRLAYATNCTFRVKAALPVKSVVYRQHYNSGDWSARC